MEANPGLVAPVESRTTKLKANLYQFVEDFKKIHPEGFGHPVTTDGSFVYQVRNSSELDNEKIKASLSVVSARLAERRESQSADYQGMH